MNKLYYIFSVLFLTILLTACGGGSSSSGDDPVGDDPSGDNPLYSSGKVVDNYIKNATVCIDSNKNNICDSGEVSTTTDENGNFSFNQTLLSTDIIISYGGVDTITGESFDFIVKNIGSNYDSNNKIILSSINTLIVDYMNEANVSLDTSKTAIVNFLGGGVENISEDMAITDVIANRSTQEEELQRSLKIFQMVAQLNDVNNSTSSAQSFKELAKFIQNNSEAKHTEDLTITTDDNRTVVLNANSYLPTVLSINGSDGYDINYYTDLSPLNLFNLEVVDPNGGNITYGIVSGKDGGAFESTSSGFKFISDPTYLNPLDDYNSSIQSSYDGQYVFDLNISNGTTYVIKTFTINIIKSTNNTKPTLNAVDIDIENNSTTFPVDKIIGQIGINDLGDSEIIKYEMTTSNTYFDINRSTGNIYIKSLPDIGEEDLTIRAKNSAGWSDSVIAKVITVADGDLNATATILAQTFTTIYENDSSLQTVGAVTLISDGGHSVTDYTISSDASGLFDINSTGYISVSNSFDFESTNVYTIEVKAENSNGWGDPATITIEIQDVNEAPIISQLENNTTTINFETTKTIDFTISDGDNGNQALTINVTDSNDSIVSFTQSGTLSLDLTGVEMGTSTFTITVTDDNGTANGGVDTAFYTFSAVVRASGWKLYQKQTESGYTIDNITFDGLNYSWNSSAMWYETDDANVSLEKVLLPIKILTGDALSYNKGANVNGTDGHYYVLKEDYINADRLDNTNIHDSTNPYTTADGGNMTVVDRNFQHDPVHHIFVSTVIFDSDAQDTNSYNNYGWIKDASSNYVDANESNSSYGVAKDSYENDNIKIDDLNDGNDTCSDYYGLGWRIPTSYEVGINVDNTSNNDATNGFIPAYVGVDDFKVVTSTRGSDDDHHWVYSNQTSESAGDLYKKDAQSIRCVYAIY